MKCKNCRYYTGVQTHGHGKYWGQCLLLNFCHKELNNQKHVDYISTHMNDLCYDDTDCLIKEKFNWKEKKL